MPAASAYRRAPLVNPAYVPLSDAALHPEGPMKARIQQVLNMVNTRHMSTLDSVLATKLGGYAQLPPMPDVEAAAALLPADPSRFVEIVWSASLLASSLVQLGIPLFAAHMFLLYYSILSQITPPVALAAYAAGNIADANPNKVGFTAMRLGIIAFIIPY